MIYLGFVYLHHRKLILYQRCIDSLSLAYKYTVCYIYTHIHGMYVPFVDYKTLILVSRSLLQIISDTKLFHDILVSLLLVSVNWIVTVTHAIYPGSKYTLVTHPLCVN